MSLLTGKMSKQKDLQEAEFMFTSYFKEQFIPAGRLGQWEQQALQCRLLLSTCAVNLESPKKFCPK